MKSLTVIATLALLVTGCATRRSPQSAKSATSTPASPAGPAVTSASAPGMIGAGTSVVVRTNEAISTAQDTPGKTYVAEIANDIVDQGGSLLVPSGSPVQITVVAAPTGGPAGAPDLQLALLSLTVKGKTYQVTSATAEAGVIAGSATEKPRSGALLGTGTGGAQVMTRGKEVRIPTKSSITFRLEQTIQLLGYTP